MKEENKSININTYNGEGITKEDILNAFIEVVGEDGMATDQSKDESSTVRIRFGKKDSYIFTSEILIKDSYLKFDLSFGSLEKLIEKESLAGTYKIINDSNIKKRVSKGLLDYKNDKDNSFYIAYETYCYPSITSSLLKTYIKNAMFILGSHAKEVMPHQLAAEKDGDNNE